VTASNLLSRNIRSLGRDGPTHLYNVGQTVRLKSGHGQRSSGLYRIMGTLPPIGDAPQYRIRNDSEGHERVVPEEALEPAPEGSSLIEKAFGHRK
jgi:hypothetical protein